MKMSALNLSEAMHLSASQLVPLETPSSWLPRSIHTFHFNIISHMWK